jgi:mannosyltransferase
VIDMKATFHQLKSQRWILSLTILGLFLRLFQLGEWSFWHDEALTVLLARKLPSELIHITASDVHPPLYFLLVKAFMLFGQSEFIIRLPSALCSAGSIFILYLLGRDLFDERVGQVGAFIIAISPLQLFYAQEARMYAQLLLLTVFSSWCFTRALRSDNILWWGLFTLGATLASYTAYFALPVFLAMGLYVLLVDKRPKRILHFVVAIGVVTLLYLPWIGIFFTQTRSVFDSYWIARPSPLTIFTALSAFFVSYSLPSLWIAVSLAVTLLIIFVVLNDVRHALAESSMDARSLVWLLLWGFVPLLGTYLVSLLRPIFQIRTVITASPVFYLLVAWGITRVRRRRLNLLLSLPTLVMMLVSVLNFYFNPSFAKPPWRQAAYYVQERAQPGDVVLHTSDGSFLPFLSYEPNVEHILLPEDPVAARENAPSQSIVSAVGGLPQPMNKAIQGHERAWLVIGLDHAVSHQLKQKQRFDARYRLLEETEMGGIHILAYALD